MKKIITLCLGILSFFTISAQQQNPVTWTASYKHISDAEGEIIINARIDKSWHTYSQKPTNDGPVPTTITFAPSKEYELVGKTQESAPHEEFDPAFGAKTSVFADKAEFTQHIKTKVKTGYTIAFKVEYMCCDDKMCLPPKTVDLSIKVQ